MLKAGIVGLPNVGKSTLFNALTRTRKAEAANYPFCTIEPNVGVVEVPDDRLQTLAKIAKTSVIIPAAVEFVDIAGLVAGASAGATAIGAITKSATENFAEYEQLVGGVETLFKESANVIQGYAADAYKTAGLSANEYMETVTSFSASLLQSLDGDTAQASEYANRAIIDMSDNANKMGSSMEMIQNAYQGFAKANYTMLDNLKLGYGGTQTEMQRLIADAAAMTDVQKELGVTVDASSMSFGNIVNAISVMQSSMGIAGTTAAEASQTISGSIAAMQSAWSNLVTGMADENADFETLVSNFVDSVATVGDNLLPTIDTALSGVADLIDQAFPAIMERVPAIISDFLPRVAESAVNIVKTLIDSISDNRNSIFDTAIDVMNTLIDGFIEFLPEIIVTGSLLLGRLALGLVEAVPDLVRRIPEIVGAIVSGFSAQSEDFVEIGRNIVQGLWNGIKSLGSWLGDQVSNFFGGIVDGAKSLLGIHSPSRVFASIGENMALGLGEGWNDEFGTINSQIRDGMDFGTASIGFDRSSLGVSSAGIINSVASSNGNAVGGNLTVNLVMPDGTNFARYMLPFFTDVAKSNGTPIINPT